MCFKFRVSHSGVLFAVGLINDRFKIDSRRVYLSGSSGGARVAGLVAVGYLEIFRGDIYIGDADTWEGDLVPDRRDAMKRNRYVFLAGSDDFNRRMVRGVAEKYKAAGIDNIVVNISAHMGHDLPRASVMSDAIRYLDCVSEQ